MDVNAIDYGAVPDGETDCTDALQATITVALADDARRRGTARDRESGRRPPSDDED